MCVLSNRQSYFLAVILLFVAICFRGLSILDLPAGVTSAETTTIRLAETVRQGTVTVFLQDETGAGRESAYPTALALVTAFIGNGLLGFRVVSLWAGMITLALVYTLGVRLFGRVVGLLALALLSVTFWSVLLSRLLLTEMLIPLLVVSVMLVIARALPVYRTERQESATTLAFASFGAVVGGVFYVSPLGVWLALATLVFLMYALFTRRPISRQRLSYIGFALLVVIIISVPYLLFNVNRPELSASNRVFGNYQGILNSIIKGFGGLFLVGDSNPAYNLPLRPMFDPLTFLMMVGGGIVSVMSLRYGRYALLIVFLVCLAPSAFLTELAPSFLGLSVWLVPLALLYGVGVTRLHRALPAGVPRYLLVGGVLGMLALNAYGTTQDLFNTWSKDKLTQRAYHTDLHQIARHLDKTQGEVNTLICNATWDTLTFDLNSTQRMQLTMTRRLPLPRVADCRVSMVFMNGGTQQQVIFPDATDLETAHPSIQRWLNMGQFNRQNLPDGRVLMLDVEQVLADALGLFTTTSLSSYGLEAPKSSQEVYPTVRFGGNITWLGYEPDTLRAYEPEQTVNVVTYWRVEGVLPRDIVLFTHLLSDPVTVAQNRDVIHVNPRRLQARDVFMQVTNIDIRPSILEDDYQVSVGAYQAETGARLPVFDSEQLRQGDRLLLYTIRVTVPE